MMTPKKWAVLGSAVAIMGAAVFGLRHSTRWSQAPERPTTAGSAVPVKGDSQHELRMLEKDLERKPGHVPILLRLAQLSVEAGKWEEAHRRVREALEQEPSNIDARLEMGRILYHRGDALGAIRETTKILETNPQHVDALYNLGAIYGNLGDRGKAVEYWKRASGADPQSESARRAREGIAQLSGG